MPFDGELASYKSLTRLSGSERVQELLGSYEARPVGSTDPAIPLAILPAPASEWAPDIVLAIDGSHAEVTIQNGFPGAEASYITVSSVLLDMAKLRSLDAIRPVDPREFRKIEQADSIDCALPGCNVVSAGCDSAAASLRLKFFEEFVHRRIDENDPSSETLLDTYHALLALKPPQGAGERCPYAEDDCPDPEHGYHRATGEYGCQCPLARPLYSTDALRIHEGMNPAGTNGALFAEIMQVWERVWVVHFLRMLERKGWMGSLRRIAIILDGPLAVFGHPAWLSESIEKELRRLNEVARKANDGQDILLLGIEKSGPFLEHFINLDTHPDGSPDNFAAQTVGLIDDAYIKANIIFSSSTRPYGRQTYFGRKFFYKTRIGALLVGVLPHLRVGDDDLSRADADQFPRLADALAVLDELVCVRYPNSLSALVAAHAEAAIPLNLGNTILGQMARRLIKNGSANSPSVAATAPRGYSK